MDDVTAVVCRKRKLGASSALASRAILGSTLLPADSSVGGQHERTQRGYSGSTRTIYDDQWRKSAHVSSGWGNEVDENVFGSRGLGGIVSVAVHKGSEGQGEDIALEMRYKTMIRSLQAHPRAHVFVITTANSFSARRLYHHLRETRPADRFVHQGNFIYRRQQHDSDCCPDSEREARLIAEAHAKRSMERVRVMQVFDLEGCFDAVSEVGRWLREDERACTGVVESASLAAQRRRTDDGKGNTHNSQGDKAVEQQTNRSEENADAKRHRESIPISDLPADNKRETPGRIMRTEIPDSQASSPVSIASPEGDSIDDSPTNSLSDPPKHTSSSLVESAVDNNEHHDVRVDQGDADLEPARHLIIFPTLSQLASTQMRRNQVRGHALLVQLLRNVRRLCPIATLAQHLSSSSSAQAACLIFNSTVGNEGGATTAAGGKAYGPARDGAASSPSAFADNMGIRPALGKTFGYFVDMSLLVTTLASSTGLRSLLAPRRGEPDQPAGANAAEAGDEVGRNFSVVEVLWDKHSDRGGRWGVMS